MSILSYSPCRLEGYPDSYSVTLTMADTLANHHIFEEYGYVCNAYAWEEVLNYLIEEKYHSLGDLIEYDSEPDVFVVYVKNQIDQFKIAEILSGLLHDQYRLREIVKVISPDLLDNSRYFE